MFMADLCYIFIYIIKWFLKSPACFRSHMKYENNFNWSMPTVEQIWGKKKKLLHYYRISFLKKYLKAIWPSQITQFRALYLSMKLNTGNMQRIQHVYKC